jgi:hypothetical protein
LEEPAACSSSIMKMETTGSSEILVPIYQIACFHTREDNGMNLYDMVLHWTDFVNIRFGSTYDPILGLFI